MLSAEIISELRENHAETDSDSLHFCTFDTVIVFSLLYIISTTIDYMHQLCFLYMLNYPVIYSLAEREREWQ